MKLSLVSNRYPNNTNTNNTNITTTKREKDAVFAVVNFKKLKEKVEEKMLSIKEHLMDLGFKEIFIEKLLKNFNPRKIEEKLDLLLIKRNIQSPAGWLSAALKNDYRDMEEERYNEEPAGRSGNLKSRGTMHRALNPPDKKILSSEEAIRQFHLLRHKLMAINYSRSKP